jgi:hypothetical protein
MKTLIRMLPILLFAISSGLFANINLPEPLKLNGGQGHDFLRTVAISDTTTVAAAYEERGIYVWKNSSNFSHRLLTNKRVAALAVNDSQQVLVGYFDKGLTLLLPTQQEDAGMEESGPVRTFREREIGKARADILDIKFGGNDTEFFVLSYENSFVQECTWLEKWSVETNEIRTQKIGASTARAIRLNHDRTKIITSSYDTNDSRTKNEFCVYDATTLEENYCIETKNSAKVFALFSPKVEEIGYQSGFSDFILLRNNEFIRTLKIAEDFEGVDVLSFYGSGDNIAVADHKKRAIRFYDLTSEYDGEPTAYIWPFFGGSFYKTHFSSDGHLVSWSKQQGLLLWTLPALATTPYSEVITSAEYRSLKAPPRDPSGSREMLECELVGNTLRIRNYSGIKCWGPIYWFINHRSDANELLTQGLREGELAPGETITIPLESAFNDASCSASFYVRGHGGP